MLRLSALIEISGEKKWRFDKISSCEITLDCESLTDTCVLKLPQKVNWDNAPAVPIRSGDRISVRLGYDDRLHLCFLGYVKTVSTTASPIEIRCENEMFRMKQTAAKPTAFTQTTVEEVLQVQAVDGLVFRTFGDVHLGQFRTNVSTMAALLESLKEKGIQSFFKLEGETPVLYTGSPLIALPTDQAQAVFSSGHNLIRHSLKEREAGDLKISLQVNSLQPDNTTITRELGERDGERRIRTLTGKSEEELEQWGEQELQRLRSNGLEGSFTAFGEPPVGKADTVGIVLDGVRKGLYPVVKNTLRFGAEGFRQEIAISGKAKKEETKP